MLQIGLLRPRKCARCRWKLSELRGEKFVMPSSALDLQCPRLRGDIRAFSLVDGNFDESL
jgi:hypothetical protein